MLRGTRAPEAEVKVGRAAELDAASSEKPRRQAEVKYPDYITSSFLSFLVFIMAATMRGTCTGWTSRWWKTFS